MGVCAEITQHMLRAAKRPLGVDDQVAAEQHPQPGSEGARLVQRQQAAVELEFTSMEGVAKCLWIEGRAAYALPRRPRRPECGSRAILGRLRI